MSQESSSGEADPPCQNFDKRRRKSSRLLHQRGVVAGAAFITVRRQNRCAHRERTRRLYAGDPGLADCGQRFLLPPETKTRQAERCPRLPVPRFLRDEHLRFALRCFRCAI